MTTTLRDYRCTISPMSTGTDPALRHRALTHMLLSEDSSANTAMRSTRLSRVERSHRHTIQRGHHPSTLISVIIIPHTPGSGRILPQSLTMVWQWLLLTD